MAPPRRKAPKQEAPQTLEAAIQLLSKYRDLVVMMDDLTEQTAQSMARIAAEADLAVAPYKLQADALFRQLRARWGVAQHEMTDGKRKSVDLAGCVIGERTTPPALKLPKGKTADEIVAALLAEFDGTFVATKHKLDKPAIIKAIRPKCGPVGDELTDEQAQALIWHSVLVGDLGLDVSQKEEFFIDHPRKIASPETVADEPEAVS